MTARNALGAIDQFRFDAPLTIDAIPEFNAMRILLVTSACGRGINRRIDGRTKLAKLDFFVRYPRFLEVAVARLRQNREDLRDFHAGDEGVEASMIRYRFGPWDHSFYNVIALLHARGLIRIGGTKIETYTLTEQGKDLVSQAAQLDAFAAIVERCEITASAFGSFSGTAIKDFVYDTFVSEIAALPFGTAILDLPPASNANVREPDAGP